MLYEPFFSNDVFSPMLDQYPNRKRGFFYLRAQTHATAHEYKLFHTIHRTFFDFSKHLSDNNLVESGLQTSYDL